MATRWKHRRIFTCTAAERNRVNAELVKHGYGPDNCNIPLSTNGKGTPTHYACECTLDPASLAIFQNTFASLAIGSKERKSRDEEGKRQKIDNVLKNDNLKRIGEGATRLITDKNMLAENDR